MYFNSWSNLTKRLFEYNLNLLKKGLFPKGVAIGTHNGILGEWVPSVLSNITNAILIEASLPQFLELKKNYEHFDNVKLINEVISTQGQILRFWEGQEGQANSVHKNVTYNWEKHKDSIKYRLTTTTNINKYVKKDTNWLHLDTEGYDADLILNLKYLPKFIIFEHDQLEKDELYFLKETLERKNYIVTFENNNCLAELL